MVVNRMKPNGSRQIDKLKKEKAARRPPFSYFDGKELFLSNKVNVSKAVSYVNDT